MGCEESELWITYRQNSRGTKPATTQLIELEFQSHKLNDLEDVLDHVFAQGWVESHYRSIAWWEKHDGTKLKNAERVEGLLKQGIGKCDSTSLKLVIADCAPSLWISYVFLKCPNPHTSVQRINLTEISDPCCKIERLAHVANFVFRKGYLPAKVRSFVHWEDACKRRLEEHTCIKDLICERGVGKDEDRPLRLVIGLDSTFATGWIKLEADSSFKTTPLAPVETRNNIEGQNDQSRVVLREWNLEPPPESYAIPLFPLHETFSPAFSSITFSPSYQTFSSSFSSSPPSSATQGTFAPWTPQHILFGTILFLSCTAVLYSRICCGVCEHCRLQ